MKDGEANIVALLALFFFFLTWGLSNFVLGLAGGIAGIFAACFLIAWLEHKNIR